ncbi:MAG: HNH endonuclease [Anaerolineae bacterium]|nr:HNH endonuclease [Anaerolineae bacterium]
MGDIRVKRCTKCGLEYPATSKYFFSDTTKADGLYSSCKACRAKYRTANAANIRQYKREHRQQNIDIFREREHQYYKDHRDHILAVNRERRRNFHHVYLPKEREYRRKNRTRINLKRKENRSSDLEATNKYNRDYRKRNPEIYRESGRKHYALHRDRVLAGIRDYARRNQPRIRMIRHRYKDRKESLPNTLTANQWLQVVEYFQNRCAYCGILTDLLTIEHVVPVSNPACIGTVAHNIIPACYTCNASKRHTEVLCWLNRRFGDSLAEKILLNIKTYFNSLPEVT